MLAGNDPVNAQVQLQPKPQPQISCILSSIGKKLYLDSATADVHFIVGRMNAQTERVPAHKLLLITASEVFQTMFNGSWKEQDEVRIVDATADSFKEFLQFFYLGRIELTMDNVSDVMNLSKKYDITDGLKMCTEFLITNVTSDDICWAFELAVLFQQKRLRQFCEIFIGTHSTDIFKSKSFLHAIVPLYVNY